MRRRVRKKLLRRLCSARLLRRASDASGLWSLQVFAEEATAGLTPDCVGLAADLLVVLVPVWVPEVAGVDWLPLSWPPFEVDMSEAEARFETGGPGKT